MSTVVLVDREMTKEEYIHIKKGFESNTLESGNPLETSERHGFVAVDGSVFVGCVSGLARRWEDAYGRWFYLTDLFVEKPYRRKGYGKELLRRLEDKVRSLAVERIWTWTAGFEAPGFYQRQGYEVFSEFKDWYASGHSRIGVWKKL